jgi:hypothetical protein
MLLALHELLANNHHIAATITQVRHLWHESAQCRKWQLDSCPKTYT